MQTANSKKKGFQEDVGSCSRPLHRGHELLNTHEPPILTLQQPPRSLKFQSGSGFSDSFTETHLESLLLSIDYWLTHYGRWNVNQLNLKERDYPGLPGLNVSTTKISKNGKGDESKLRERDVRPKAGSETRYVARFEDGGRQLEAKERRPPLEAEEAKETDSLLEPQEGNTNTSILAQ